MILKLTGAACGKFGFDDDLQRFEQEVVRLLQESCSKLVQQPTDVLGRIDENLGISGITLAMQLDVLQGGFKGPGNF